ncbi:hypothetical protein [Neptuniibacter caesariensis]|uniref:Tyrosine recombinase n=1 Tax=Neptuniibacter caesariensis TaxID=207954 RepID=A0A7U8GU44_NEPCE|nr:hypothetical protein [Neptuniibacter caesariensis]EAR62947.1 tyrosine recombinase [Oceanospirillum sp. MED92] [Neptuniibacter caesariensis]
MPRKLIKNLVTLLVIIGLPVGLFAGAYGFVWWKVSTVADDFAKEIAPFAAMEYRDVHIDLGSSELGLKGITFRPTGMEGEIVVDAATLKAPSWGFLLDLESKLSKGELPESFNVDLKGINLNLQSGYMQDWGRMAEDMQRQVGAGQSYEVLACGNRDYFSVADLRNMGYSDIISDVAFQYSFDAIDRQLNFDMQSKAYSMADMSMSMSVAVASDNLNMQTMMFAQPQLKRVEMRFYDRGYNVRKNRFCAKEIKTEVDAYRERYKGLLEKRLKYEGWSIPTPLFDSFDLLNNPGASAYLRVDLPDGFGVQSMAMVQQPTDLINLLSPYVEFNGQPVQLDGLAWSEPDPEGERLLRELQETEADSDLVLGEESVIDEQQAESDVVPEFEKRSRSLARFKANGGKSFKSVEVPELSGHLGKPVVLYTYFGRKVEGRLVSVKNNIVTVEHRLVSGRGTATYPIAADKIQSVKLYY